MLKINKLLDKAFWQILEYDTRRQFTSVLFGASGLSGNTKLGLTKETN